MASSDKKNDTQPTRPVSASTNRGKVDKAFDNWLKQSLHAMYDEIANEPLPDDLLRLISDHAEKTKTDEPPTDEKPK
ncbi:NepR family anti-sigma factor [Lacibacterium aquatile]|uniref:NepR family anti-sigma factor n=1 Tax=Lacibacterium aquatile TaxID=1168082 RepID=A0ABW5DX71_9PROT